MRSWAMPALKVLHLSTVVRRHFPRLLGQRRKIEVEASDFQPLVAQRWQEQQGPTGDEVTSS